MKRPDDDIVRPAAHSVKDATRVPDNTGQKQAATQFQPGRSGNPVGRPKGSRNKISEAFVGALYADFVTHGVGVIARVRDEKPEQYLKVIASILPKDVNLSVNAAGDMTDAELIERIRELDAAIDPVLRARNYAH